MASLSLPSLIEYKDKIVRFIHLTVAELACLSLRGIVPNMREKISRRKSTLFKNVAQYGHLDVAIDASVEHLFSDVKFRICFAETMEIQNSIQSSMDQNEELKEELYEKKGELFSLFIDTIGLFRVDATHLDYYDSVKQRFEDLFFISNSKNVQGDNVC